MSKFSDGEVDTLLASGGNNTAKVTWHKTFDSTFKIPGTSTEERAHNVIHLTFVQRAWTGEKPPPDLASCLRPSSFQTTAKPTTATSATRPRSGTKPKPHPKSKPTVWHKILPHLTKTWRWLSGLELDQQWSGDQLMLCSDEQDLERQLRDKLTFARKGLGLAGDPSGGTFGGIHVLRSLSSSLAEADLFYAIEVLDLRPTGVHEALDKLESYAAALRSSQRPAHPLLLIALARCASKLNLPPMVTSSLYQCFNALYVLAAQKWMTTSERAMLNDAPTTASTGKPKAPSPVLTGMAAEWQQLCQSGQCSSPAMNELLAMVGLNRVKQTALNLFKSALALQRMPVELQQKNKTMTLNYCFTGNPGTGKTTVARLFARILVDSQLRRNHTLQSCSAQQVKDDGPRAFRATIQKAMGGVLYIDEAYELEPLQDLRGKPIVTELLVAAEDLRHDLSVILAGYEDDIQRQLYAYNSGLRSRFVEVSFDDFDANDLRLIWNQLVRDRGWRCSDDNVGVVACRKLAKAAGRKGFGNARAIRQLFETAVQRAMARPTFHGKMPTIELVDIVGERPTSNVKLADVLKEIDAKIGWGRIKQLVRELVDLCDINYEREVGDGGGATAKAATIPVMLNRLILGNPCTGKTTFGSLYGRVLKHLNLLTNGDVVKKTAGDFVGSAVGQSQAKTNEILEQAKGKVLIIDETYNLNDSLYGKQVLDVLVEKIQGTESDDIAVILIGYEAQMTEMLRV